jgi:ubiquinone/menaquinone biosynthesis C-methylase UbiE
MARSIDNNCATVWYPESIPLVRGFVMIVCPTCAAKTRHFNDRCEGCGFSPPQENGFSAWAPDLAKENDGFPKESFEALAQVENGNFWFRSRNDVIIWSMRKYIPRFQSLLEVGCGTGYVLSGISAAFPGARIVGSEIYTIGLSVAAGRLPDVELLQMDARKLPYEEEFDVLAAFDVIEHIAQDELVLSNFYRAVVPGGTCVLTVPQHKWLWSPVDEAACHQRRYSAAELHNKLVSAGFRVTYSTSFVTLLLPLMLMSRLNARQSGKVDGNDGVALNVWVDRVLRAVMRIELQMIKWGIRFPIGGSRLVVAHKPR